MRDAMLVLHFIGLAMGIGSGFAFMFLGIASAKIPQEERLPFMMRTGIIGMMGQIGLLLLIISGGYLITPYLSGLSSMPLLIAKLCLTAVLIVIVVMNSISASKAKKGDAARHLKNVPTLGRIALLTGLTIVILAVMVFH